MKCPTCGKEFTPCKSNLSSFNWRRIACSYDCAKQYTERVEAERRKRRSELSKGKYLEQKAKEDLGIDVFKR